MKNGMVHICIPKSSDIIPHFAVKVVLPTFYNSGCYIHFIILKFHLMKNNWQVIISETKADSIFRRINQINLGFNLESCFNEIVRY